MPKAGEKTEPFIVIDRGLRILITPCEGWYAVQGLDVRGLNTQGRTIEEAICMAHDAAKALAAARETMARKTSGEIRNGGKTSAPAARRSRRRQPVGA